MVSGSSWESTLKKGGMGSAISASQPPGRGPTDVDDALIKNLMIMMMMSNHLLALSLSHI